jgi:hypothetical protein
MAHSPSRKLRQAREQWAFDHFLEDFTEPEVFTDQAVSLLLDPDPDQVLLAVGLSADAVAGLAQVWKLPRTKATRRATEELAQADLIRCFGNPFRPITFSPEWRTDTTLSLAQQMYDSRDFGAMPILADALQDAGCEDEQLLTHCRGPGPHVRGCWVVDLVLGKE